MGSPVAGRGKDNSDAGRWYNQRRKTTLESKTVVATPAEVEELQRLLQESDDAGETPHWERWARESRLLGRFPCGAALRKMAFAKKLAASNRSAEAVSRKKQGKAVHNALLHSGETAARAQEAAASGGLRSALSDGAKSVAAVLLGALQTIGSKEGGLGAVIKRVMRQVGEAAAVTALQVGYFRTNFFGLAPTDGGWPAQLTEPVAAVAVELAELSDDGEAQLVVDQLLEQLRSPRVGLPPSSAASASTSASASPAATALVAKLLPFARTVLGSIRAAKAKAGHGQSPVHMLQGPRKERAPVSEALDPAAAAVVGQRFEEADGLRTALLASGAEAFAALRGRGFAALAEALPSLAVPISQRNNQVRRPLSTTHPPTRPPTHPPTHPLTHMHTYRWKVAPPWT